MKQNSPTLPTNDSCHTLHYLLPPTALSTPPYFVPYAAKYSCFPRFNSTGKAVGNLPWCNTTVNVTADTTPYQAAWFSDHKTARADVWWDCKCKRLRPLLPCGWSRTCVVVQLVMPFHASPMSSPLPVALQRPHRARGNAAGGSFDGGMYIDEIGVPRGVPNEYKA